MRRTAAASSKTEGTQGRQDSVSLPWCVGTATNLVTRARSAPSPEDREPTVVAVEDRATEVDVGDVVVEVATKVEVVADTKDRAATTRARYISPKT